LILAGTYYGGCHSERRLFQTHAPAAGDAAASFEIQPQTPCPTLDPQAIELCDEDAQLNETAFQMAQKLNMI
jgi:hypothetical protein